MTDPLSVTVGIIAVASLAYSSSKALYELISTIQDAPPVFQELNQYIAALSQILEALKTNLNGRGTRLSESQIECLQEAKPTLEGCDLACKDFKAKMEGLTIHSHDGRRSFRDSIKLHFQNKSISDFRIRLAGWKESLALALDVTLLTSMSANTEAFKALEIKIDAAEVQISTNLQVVNTRLEKLLASEPESEEDMQIITQKRGVEEEQKAVLMQCLSLCQTAAGGATQTTGHSFRNNKVFDESRVIYGNVGQIPAGSAINSYDGNIASGKAVVVMGNIDGANFLGFLK
ncbi:hypothetical protein BJ875DRAFT_465450 [Amylocarpus encephaloides]|uniref:Azaphilone pigments biosynthesis cluster protein L N-terminal domain-containing protein n=1 Tax=Amylocarpus encephaloides TaxID=45428 RepID=A0A9P8C4A1_9HELO|nr:hypothetical protein BJ875DRAFT_465450 [Amylocarpus encephaloides]